MLAMFDPDIQQRLMETPLLSCLPELFDLLVVQTHSRQLLQLLPGYTVPDLPRIASTCLHLHLVSLLQSHSPRLPKPNVLTIPSNDDSLPFLLLHPHKPAPNGLPGPSPTTRLQNRDPFLLRRDRFPRGRQDAVRIASEVSPGVCA